MHPRCDILGLGEPERGFFVDKSQRIARPSKYNTWAKSPALNEQVDASPAFWFTAVGNLFRECGVFCMSIEKHIPGPKSMMRQNWKYIVCVCKDCHKQYEKPSTWRKTQRCPSCDRKWKKHLSWARAETKRLLDKKGWPSACEKCGVEDIYLSPHHIVSLSKGGSYKLHNVKCICMECHSKEHFSC